MKRLGFARTVRSMRGAMLRYMPLMITCRQFEDFMIDYLEGDLPGRQVFVFELHLKVCGECRGYMAAYKRAVEVATRAEETIRDEVELPAVPEDLVKAIIASRKA